MTNLRQTILYTSGNLAVIQNVKAKKTNSGLFAKHCLIVAAVALLIAIVMVSFFLKDVLPTDNSIKIDPNQVRLETLETLSHSQGLYDEKSIVLPNTSRAEAQALAERFDGKLRITKNGKFATITLNGGKTVLDIYKNAANNDIITSISPDYSAKISDVNEEETTLRQPSKPNYNVYDTFYDRQTYFDYINIGNTWKKDYRGYGITVAIIDTGIDTDHSEFEGRISPNSYYASEDKIVKDYISENGDYDWSLIEDEQGHGTAVAGTIAAAMNGVGTVGVAPEATLLIIKVACDSNGSFYRSSDLVFGLYYAIECDAPVVNMSFGGRENIYSEATRLGVDSNVLMVAAAGNEGNAQLTYPAADENVIGVGALAENSWDLADYSNYGENVDLVAPGTVFTTKVGGGYDTISGTSFASPIVAGALALLKNHVIYYTYENSQIEELVYASCYDLGSLGKDWYYGYGALDVNALCVEEKGTVTFNMLTDELKNTTQTFIRNHTLQNMPEPERLYSVFDGWYYDIHCTEPYNWYEDVFVGDLTLYANWANEDDGVPYTYVTLEDGTIEIRSYTGKRKYITIPEMIENKKVTSIGAFAFQNQSRIRQITLPSGLKHIGQNAFSGCYNLLSITLPKSVETIEAGAFQNAVRLSNVYIPIDSNLSSIGNFAFAHSGLRTIDLPQSLNEISGSVFYGTTSMVNINVSRDNAKYVSDNGILFNKTKSKLIVYPAGRTSDYSVPTVTETIDAYAFAFAKFAKVNLNCVKSIGIGAFAYSSLETVKLPSTLFSLGASVFAYNVNLSFVDLGSNISIIPEQAFIGDSALKSITIPSQVTDIDEQAFAKTGIKNVIFEPDSALRVIGYRSFYQSPIQSIEMPNSLMMIGNEAFSKCFMLSSVTFKEKSALRYIGDSAFKRTFSLESISLPSELRAIGSFAFCDSAISGSVTIPANVETLGIGAFAACHKITSIDVSENNLSYVSYNGVVYSKDGTKFIAYPAGNSQNTYTINTGVVKVEDAAFYGAWNLKNIVMQRGISEIGEYAFFDCKNVTDYSLPNTLSNIEQYAFAQNSALTNISIPDAVTHIGQYVFDKDTSLAKISFGDDSKLARIGFAAFSNSGITSFRVPSNVSTISQKAFENCTKLTSIVFAKNSQVQSISAHQFTGCSALTSITFEQGSALTHIQAHGFEGMSKLTDVDFGDAQLIEIDNYAFRFCESLSSLTIPSTLINIGRFAFYNCKSLSQLNLPYGIEHIGKYAFLGTKNCSIYFEAENLPTYLDENWDYGIAGYYTGVLNVKATDDGAFKIAELADGTIAIVEYIGTDPDVDISTYDFGGTLVNIGGYAFFNKGITSIVLPNTIRQIQRYAFAYNKKLAHISIPASTNYIANYAFYDTGIASLSFDGNNVKIIEQYAFALTKNLKQVTIPSGVTRMGGYAFYGSGIEKLDFEDGCSLTEIPKAAFANTNLHTVRIPESVQVIGESAFRDNSNLASVDIVGADKLRILGNAFYNTGLSTVHIPSNVEYVGEYAFVGLTKLSAFSVDSANKYYSSIDGILYNKIGDKLIAFPAGRTGVFTIPKQVENIGFGAFENTALNEIKFEYGINLLTLGYRAFYNADSLTTISIPASVVAIDYFAFAQCDKLTTIDFSANNSLKGIYEGAFYGCTNLKNITLPDSIVEVSDYAFYGCLSIDKLPVAANSQILGVYSHSFAYTGISKLDLPSTLMDIGEYAFSGLPITELTIPDDNKQNLVIGLGAFANCDKLESMTLPFIGASYENEEITWFGYIFGAGGYAANATYVPASLKHVTITDGISFVGEGAFYELTTIETLDMPSTVDTLYFNAFGNSTIRYELANPVKLSYKKEGCNEGMATNSFFGKGITGKVVLPADVKYLQSNVFENCNYLTEVILPDAITSIPYRAFYGCAGLNGIILPDSVIEIGSYAFYGCINLTTITIPENVTIIADYAFSDCTGLTVFTIPDNVTSIGNNAFEGCTGLTRIEIGTGVTSIGACAFSNCTSLNGVYIKDIAQWCNIDFKLGWGGNIESNPLYNANKLYLNEELVTDLIIPDGVTRIGNYAFEGYTRLVSVTIPNSVTSIGASAFNGCNGLTSIAIPEGVTNIGYGAFRNCESLTSITLPNSLTRIGSSAFSDCRSLLSLDIPDGMEETGIDQYTFKGCDSLQSLKIGNGPTSIGYKAFYDFKNLTDITIPDSVTSIDGHAFENCTSLIKVEIGSGVTSIGSNAFYNCKSLSGVYIKDIAKWCGIDYEWFDSNPLYYAHNLYLNGESVSNLVIPDDVTSIGNYAFSECANLASITIGKGVTSISDCAFDGCERLYEVINNSDLPITLGSGVARYAKVIVDKNGNKTYKDGEFLYIDTADGFKFGLENGKYVLYSYNGTEDTITLPESINGNPYEIYRFAGGKNIIIPDTITSIGDEAFIWNESIVSVTIGNGVTSIGKSAFYGCKNLVSVIIDDGVISIGERAFENCTSLASVTIGGGVTSIGNSAFYGCTELANVEMGNAVTTIGERAFYGCARLASITIPDGVTTIDSSIFVNSGIVEITIGENNSSFVFENGQLWTKGYSKLLYVAKNITELILPEGITSISDSLFEGKTELNRIVIPDSVTSIGYKAFYGCSGLTSVTIGNKVTYIGSPAFYGCYKLVDVYNKSSLNIVAGSSDNGYVAYYAKNVYVEENGKLSIDENGYEIYTDGTEKILISYIGSETQLVLPSYITQINKYAFYNCSKIESILIPDSVTNIGEYAFSGCSGLTNITIGKGITLINKSTFDGCSELNSIYYTGNIAGWCGISGLNNLPLGSRTLYIDGNKVEGDLIIPDGVTSIADCAFYSCNEITSVTIPTSLTSIGKAAFFNCTEISTIYYMGDVAGWCGISGLGNVMSDKCILYIDGNKVEGDLIIPDGVTSIADYAFYKCNEITSITIPASLTNIGEKAFYDCFKLKYVYYTGDVAGWCEISGLFYNIMRGSLYIGGNIVEGDLIIPEGVTSIGDYAFYNRNEITSIRIPDSVTYIGDYAFYNCDKLANIVVSENNDTFSSIDGILYDKNKTRLIFVPQAIQGAITIPDSVTSIANLIFAECDELTSIIVSENNSSYSSVDGILYNKDKTQIIFVPRAIQGVITIPDSVTDIRHSTFSGCTGITGVVIGNGVTSIGQAFSECGGLTHIIIPDSVTSIDGNAFQYCASLTSITIGKGVTSIGNDAFEGCSALREVINNSDLPITLGSSDYGKVAYYALVLVDKNGDKTYKDGEFTYIDTVDGFRFGFVNGQYVLYAYIGTKDAITLPDSINGNSYEINYFKGGQKVIFPDWMTNIDENAFWWNSTLTEIVIPDSVTTIGRGAFGYCKNLKKVTIGNGLTSIGGQAFLDCASLTSVTIGNGLINIGYSAFGNCSNLAEVSIESTVIQRIGSNAFKGTAYYNNPENWVDNCLFIGDVLLAVDKQLTYLETDHNICAIAIDAFNDCYLLKQVKLGGYVARDYNLLAPTTNVETIVLSGNQLQHLHYYYGVNWSSIPSSVKNVIILSDCEMVNSELFVGSSNLRIFVEKAREDCMWDENYPGWNNANKVLYKGDWAKAIWRDTTGKIIGVDYYSASEVVKPPFISVPDSKEQRYRFVGWDTNGDGIVDGIPATLLGNIDATAIIVSEKAEYLVEFIDKDGETVIWSYLSGYNQKLVLPENPQKTGYDFVGWKDCYDDMLVTGDMKIYSIWEHQNGNHDYVDSIVDPTCTEKGYTIHTCTICGESYKTDFTDALGHRFGDWIIDVDATCHNVGGRHRSCDCGEVETEEIAQLQHVLVATVTKEPSCTKEGERTYECALCGDKYIEVISKSAHNYVKKYASISYIERLVRLFLKIFFGYEGNRAYYFECSVCGKIMEENESMLVGTASVKRNCAHSELGDWGVSIGPSCVNGMEVRKCLECGEVADARSIVATGEHVYGDWFEAVSPDCTHTGISRRECRNCEHFETEIIDALGHDELHHDAKAPTCTGIGWDAYVTCSRCDYTTYKEKTALGHDFFEDWTIDVAATCDWGGRMSHHCSRCDEVSDVTETDPLGHDYVYIPGKEATCTEHGWDDYATCSRCDFTTYEEKPALGHVFSEDWTIDLEATCTTDGSKSHHCLRCDAVSDVTKIYAHGHDEIHHSGKEATCTEYGWDAYVTCSLCDYTTFKRNDALGHDFAEAWTIDVQPTCTSEGSKSHHCSRCDVIADVTVVASLGHDEIYHNGKEATCLEYGWDEYVTCSRCDYTTYKKHAALGHDFAEEWTIDVQPTCTNEGSKSRHCSRCDEIIDVTVVASLGHNFGEWTTSVNPTYENEGEEQRACSTCGEVEKRSVPRLSRGPLVFADMVTVVNNASGDAKREAINSALSYYNSLTDEEKIRAAESYESLQKEISAYEQEIETEKQNRLILIISLSIATALILAVGVICIVFRKKLFKRKK